MIRILALVMAAAILVVSLLPRPPMSFERASWSDKVEHGLAYAAWGVVLGFALAGRRRPFLLALLIGVLFGGLIELLQPLTGRHGDVLDLLADAVGVGAGAAAALALRRRPAGPAE